MSDEQPAQSPPKRRAATPTPETLDAARPIAVAAEDGMTPDEVLAKRIADLRYRRTSFGARKSKLAHPKIPGYHICWFADHPGRIEELIEAGYEHVKDHQGKVVQRVHGRQRDGRALIGYLMKIPEVLWKEDLSKNDEATDQAESAVRVGTVAAEAKSDKPGVFYRPDFGAGVKTELHRSKP